MDRTRQFYIDGAWVDPTERRTLAVVNPATEEPIAEIALGAAADVDRAVAAARRAFPAFAATSREDRLALLARVVAAFKPRLDDIAAAITAEMGAPIFIAKPRQASSSLGHLAEMIQVLADYRFETLRGSTMVRLEPIGVCGFITPWNWPINQIVCKVAPALAAGCTMVLKPSEVAPLDALIVAEILHEAGVPPGVFNLVNGTGPEVGAAIAAHPDIDMVSFTGSTRAGIEVARAAAPSVKRVHQELGGKSPNIVLSDADVGAVVARDTERLFVNSGQSCNAGARLLVPLERQEEAVDAARRAAETVKVGPPTDPETRMGPVVSAAQFEKIQRLIQGGIAEGARLVTGGTGRPEGLNRGYYVRPTIFANVRNDMTIAREEIFGPVLAILPYRDEEEAIAMANDTPYGLSAYVSSGDLEHARRVATRLRAGNVHLNGAGLDIAGPFGGYKQSGNGREWGAFGLHEFLEIKGVFGYQAA